MTSSACKLEYKYDTILFLNAITEIRRDLIGEQKTFETFIYLKELKKLYLELFKHPEDTNLKQNVIDKIKEKDHSKWMEIIKFYGIRERILKNYQANRPGDDATKDYFDELKLMEELMGLQTGDILGFDQVSKGCMEYLASIPKFTLIRDSSSRSSSISQTSRGIRKSSNPKFIPGKNSARGKFKKKRINYLTRRKLKKNKNQERLDKKETRKNGKLSRNRLRNLPNMRYTRNNRR